MHYIDASHSDFTSYCIKCEIPFGGRITIMKSRLPVVYACSGCSNVAQMANSIALRLNDESVAEMSCIAGVGGKVAALVNKAKISDKIIAIDGCRLHCCESCLDRINIKPDLHIKLYEFGQKKIKKTQYDEVEAARIYKNVISMIEAME